MDKSVKKVRINIPMVLTWTRIALIPLIVGVFMIPTSVLSMHSQNLLGCIFFIVAAVTDALDGFIARRYGMGTTLGAFLDPVADKLMVSAALIVLLAFGRVDMLVALVIIGKVKVNWFGKIKAIAQMVSIPMLLYFDPIGAWNVYLTGTILIYIAAILTIYSMFVYLKAAAPFFSSEPKQK